MGMQINNNLGALNAYRNLSVTQNDLNKSLEKLSSGFRINRASDDAAGLAISEGLRSQVSGLKVAARNAQDGISVVQTAEGALTEVHSMLHRLRDLAVQGANDSNNAAARTAITTEATALVSELDRISKSTNFGGTKLLDGSANLSFQVGADGDVNSRITVDLTAANITGVATTLSTASGGATTAIATPTLVTGAAAFTITDGTTNTTVTTTLGAAGTYKSVDDVAKALNSDAGFAAKLHASVNDDNELVVTALSGGSVVGGGTGGTQGSAGTGFATSAANAGGGISFATHASSQAAIGLIDAQISAVSTARSTIGASQNRFERAINNINVSVENLTASESRIRDTDMAQEMVSFTRANILQQAGTAMLAQANQLPQGVLQLLR